MLAHILEQQFLTLLSSDIGLIILAVFIQRFLQYASQSSLLLAYLYLPGTFLHELMHYIVALLFYAYPSNFSLKATKTADGYRLGSVSISNAKWYNTIPVALAPLLLLPLAFLFYDMLYDWGRSGWWQYLLFVGLMVVIVTASTPSKADIELAFKYKWGVIFYICLCALLLLTIYAYHFNRSFLLRYF